MTIAIRPAVRIEPLIAYAPSHSDGPLRGGRFPEVLRQEYGGDLSIPLRTDRPTVVANFVSSIDGVVSLNVPDKAGGGEISGFFEPDRFVMGLLRSLADAVLIGAGTVRDTASHVWTPSHTHPSSADAFAALREELHLTAQPTTVVVTASGDVDLSRKGLARPDVPVKVITTDIGRLALLRQAPIASHVELIGVGGERVEPEALIQILGERGFGLVVCEGGPHLFGQLVSARLVSELFLTIAPQIAGRSAEIARLALVEGCAFTLAGAPWMDLVDLRRSGSHLFARYRFREDSK